MSAQKYAGKHATPAWEAAVTLTASCKEDKACYLRVATDRTNQTEAAQHTVLKALTMVGVLGGEAERDALLRNLDVVAQPATKERLAQVIDLTRRSKRPCASTSPPRIKRSNEVIWPFRV